MYENWGVSADPTGRYAINNEVRKVLNDEWVRTEAGWAYASDPGDTVLEAEDFDMWREAFENKHEDRAAVNEGLGRFGI